MSFHEQNISSIDTYISQFPKEIQKALKTMREIIKQTAPEYQESITYGIPTIKIHGKNLVHFGAFKKHIGFYPTPSAIHKFQKKISAYEITKGSIKFPLNQPIPRDLIQEIIEFRISEFNTIH